MKYLIDNEGLNFNNPVDAVLFALNNNRSVVKVTQEETNLTECKSRGGSKSVQISDSVLKLLLRWENANWVVVTSPLGHITLVKD
jgi:hypothetical protein